MKFMRGESGVTGLSSCPDLQICYLGLDFFIVSVVGSCKVAGAPV
jgi:hypothetical protein